jgi:hypothetical protein
LYPFPEVATDDCNKFVLNLWVVQQAHDHLLEGLVLLGLLDFVFGLISHSHDYRRIPSPERQSGTTALPEACST